ncbi:unnamed protein product [Trichobilharzia regenti]|nr:unnamed protein product [Trichobilharzia regenti]
MANPFAETILEGFICPKCMLTFGTPDLLSHHFILEHQDSVIAESEGTCHSLTSKFLELRKCHVNRSSVETNSLLIRLEKLIEVVDAHETFEQTIVPWINAKVDLCPSCGKAFGLGTEIAYPDENDDSLDSSQNTSNSISKYWLSKTNVTRLTNAILDYNPIYRRRHHCRLCGSILCADCSYFISVNKARNLLNALNGQDLDIFPGSVNTTDTGNESDRCLESENMFRPGNIRFTTGGKCFS